MMNPGTANGMVQASINYQLQIERAQTEAQSLSTEYLRGYIDHYESARGIIGKTMSKIFDALDLATEPTRITGFKMALESKLNEELKQK